jgi:aspartate carbamoyltransferase catalytic subunit
MFFEQHAGPHQTQYAHPAPAARVGEIHTDVDANEKAYYFDQAATVSLPAKP